MTDDIFSFNEMCRRENDVVLQRGMNFGLGKNYSVILMSRASNAPYRDRIEDGGITIIYEGHDMPRTKENSNPKSIDQQGSTPKGTLTQNGKFYKAAHDYKAKKRPAELVKVYEKIRPGIWTYNGVFKLTDSWKEKDDTRNVFMFKLEATEDSVLTNSNNPIDLKHRRIIPTWVKREVWKRDKGKCIKCGSTNNLHFDHVIPFSKGGASITPDNVQILCARHNIVKSDNIE